MEDVSSLDSTGSCSLGLVLPAALLVLSRQLFLRFFVALVNQIDAGRDTHHRYHCRSHPESTLGVMSGSGETYWRYSLACRIPEVQLINYSGDICQTPIHTSPWPPDISRIHENFSTQISGADDLTPLGLR